MNLRVLDFKYHSDYLCPGRDFTLKINILASTGIQIHKGCTMRNFFLHWDYWPDISLCIYKCFTGYNNVTKRHIRTFSGEKKLHSISSHSKNQRCFRMFYLQNYSIIIPDWHVHRIHCYRDRYINGKNSMPKTLAVKAPLG